MMISGRNSSPISISEDEIGTPFCVTVDFDTIEDNAVTIRFRDTLKQERIPIEELKGKLKDLLDL